MPLVWDEPITVPFKHGCTAAAVNTFDLVTEIALAKNEFIRVTQVIIMASMEELVKTLITTGVQSRSFLVFYAWNDITWQGSVLVPRRHFDGAKISRISIIYMYPVANQVFQGYLTYQMGKLT